MKTLAASALMLVSFSAFGALKCETKPPANTPAASLKGLAKISMAAAEKAALAHLGARRGTPTVAKSDLEVEDGCLVYSFDIRIAGKTGVEEILVDAANGKILSAKHETPRQEAAEKAKDKAEAKKAK